MVPLHLVWMFLKLIRGKRVISPSPCLDVLKIRMKMRINDLNKIGRAHAELQSRP